MCVPLNQRDPRSRRLMVIGALFLAAALLLRGFAHLLGPDHPWLDALVGLFLGISIGVNLFSVRFARRCRTPHTSH